MCERDADPEDARMADYHVDLDILDAALDRWIVDCA
jgi:hypothetical protein